MSIRCCMCVAGVFVLLTAATSSAQQAPGKGADACKLVTKAEVEQAIGVKLKDGVQAPRMQNPGVLSTCDYGEGDMGQVSILIRRNAMKFVAGTEKAEFEKQGMKLTYTKALPGTAAYIDMMGMGTGLIVFRGDYDYLQVSAMATGVNKKDLPPRLEKLARLVLERWK